MSLADLLGRASPIYKLYSGDQKILEDYKGAYDKYQSEYDAYKAAYDDYAKRAADYQARANAYNAAVAAWNEGPRTTPYEQTSGYVAHPGEFTMTAPGAPADPGFTGEDVEAFSEQAQGRARRRGNAMATAQALMGRGSEGVGGTQPIVTISGDGGPNLSGFSIAATPFAEGGTVQEDSGIGMLFRRFAEGGAVGSDPTLALRQRVIETYGFDPAAVAVEEGVDPTLLLRMMQQESGGRADAVSPKGAFGLMQLMPATAEMLGVDPTDPIQNVRGGARYLRMMLDEFGTVPLALAAYNAGPGRVRDYQGIPPFEETRNYVAAITGVDASQILPEMGNYFNMPGVDQPVERPRMRPEGLGTADYVLPEPMISEYLMLGYMPRTEDRRPVAIPNLSMPATPLEQAARQRMLDEQALQMMQAQQAPQEQSEPMAPYMTSSMPIMP